MTESPADPRPDLPSRARPRLILFALIASAALNALLAGVLIGGVLRHRAGLDERGLSLGAALRHGPPEARAAARAMIAERGPAFEALRAEARAARAAVASAARAEPLDRAALDAALGRLAAAEAGLARHRHAAFADLVARLGPEGRAALIDRFERRRGGGA